MAEPMSRRKETSSILKEYSRTPPPEKTRLSRELNTDTGLAQARLVTEHALQKGGVPAAPSGTATLLRLSPNYQFRSRPILAVTDFRHPRLSWLDGRCVQGPGTYSPQYADLRLLAIPTSRRRVAACDPNWDRVFEVRSPSRVRCSLLPTIVVRV